MAQPTAYDLRFRLLNIPVRVHPLFWLVMALISGGESNLPLILTFVGCAFVSILVHEFGHGLMSRAFGYRANEIVLYGMGGYCECEVERQRPWQRLAVLFAGPGAGFLLAGIVFGFYFALGDSRLSATGRRIVDLLLSINIVWGILNLFPIWPLDGGRITEVILTMFNRRHGTRWAHVVSLLTAGVLAVILFRWGQTFMGIWFAYFGFINYQVLQALHHSARYGVQEDDADWWKR